MASAGLPACGSPGVKKPHYYVIDAIDRILAETGENQPRIYSAVTYRDRKNESRRCFEVREDGVLNVIRRLRGDGADAIFEHINREFMRMKKVEQGGEPARFMAPLAEMVQARIRRSL
jgi:hypothetical protein